MCLKLNQNNIDVKSKQELEEEIKKDSRDLLEIAKESRLKQNLIEYEFIRQQGRYNMLDENARKLIGISIEEYTYIIKHYGELMKKYPDTKKQVQLRLDYIKSANIAKIVAIKGCKNCIEKVTNKVDVTINDLCDKCRKEVESYMLHKK